MFRKCNFPGRSLVALTLLPILALSGCLGKNKLVTDTGSGKKEVGKEEYLMTSSEDTSTESAMDNQYKVLTLTNGTFEEGALRQTLKRDYDNFPAIRLQSDGRQMKFGEYRAGYMEYVEAGDVIAPFYVEADEIAIEEARVTLERLQERYERAKSDIQKELEEMEEERKTIYNSYDNQIALIAYKQRQQDWENESYHYEQQIANAKQKLAELAQTTEEYEIRTDTDGYVIYTGAYVKGALLSDGAYICNIMDGREIFTTTQSQAEQFSYGRTVSFDTPDGSMPGMVVNGGKLALYGNLDTDEAVFKVTLEEDAVQNGRDSMSSLVMNASLKTIQNVLVIPKRAVTVQNNEYYVTVMQEDGSLLQTEFIPGGSNVDEYWVLRGLSEGTQIVYR